MGAAGFWMRPPIWAIGHTSINMSPGSDGLKLGYPAPVVRRTGIKWCYVCVPQRPHTTVIQFEACWPEVRGRAINVHSNPEKMSMARSKKQQFMSTAIQKNAHGEVRGIAIYVHSNPENCPRRGPSNSNLCPQQSRKMSMARSEEQQYIQQSRKIIHSVDPDDERSKQQIAMWEMMYRINWKIRQKQQQKPVRKSSNTVLKKRGWGGRVVNK